VGETNRFNLFFVKRINYLTPLDARMLNVLMAGILALFELVLIVGISLGAYFASFAQGPNKACVTEMNICEDAQRLNTSGSAQSCS
jgi:hypothetical protein